jgi:hypothetical protein
MVGRLVAGSESGERWVYLDAVRENGKIVESRFVFGVGERNGRTVVSPHGSEAEAFVREARAACASGKDPP